MIETALWVLEFEHFNLLDSNAPDSYSEDFGSILNKGNITPCYSDDLRRKINAQQTTFLTSDRWQHQTDPPPGKNFWNDQSSKANGATLIVPSLSVQSLTEAVQTHVNATTSQCLCDIGTHRSDKVCILWRESNVPTAIFETVL